MNEPTDWSLLARYLSGECSDEEKTELEAWITSDPENKRLVQFMKLVWNNPEARTQESDVKALWDEVAKKAGITAKPELKKISESTRFVPRTRKWPSQLHADSYRILRYAAAFFIVVTLGYLLSKRSTFFPWGQPAAELETFTVERGSRDTITLSDGTRIVLDAGSNLRYPERFKEGTREIFLNGEGYFEVTSDADRPFIVHANHAVIRVLGTKFNVRAWQPDQRVTVAVAEGRVSLRAEEGDALEKVVISKGQMSILPENGNPSEPIPVDVEKYLGWMHNEIVFEDAPLHEILFQLERWYDLQFVLADSAIAGEHVTVHIQKKSVDDILELISALSGLNYERQGRTIRFGHE